jgi:hypothetical protein
VSFIGAIVLMIVGGPLWLIVAVVVAGLIILADTLYKYSQGKASLLDVGLAVLSCIPVTKGLTSLNALREAFEAGGLLGAGLHLGGAAFGAAKDLVSGLSGLLRGGLGKLLNVGRDGVVDIVEQGRWHPAGEPLPGTTEIEHGTSPRTGAFTCRTSRARSTPDWTGTALTDELRYAGFFTELGFNQVVFGQTLADAAGSASDPRKDEVVAYLRSGYPVLSISGSARDLLDPDTFIADAEQLYTDGDWIWRGDLAHYVARHDVALPKEFRLLIEDRGFQRPEVSAFRLAAAEEAVAVKLQTQWS